MSEAIKEEDFNQEPLQESHQFQGETKRVEYYAQGYLPWH